MDIEFGSKQLSQSQWRQWALDQILKHNSLSHEARLDAGKDGTALFLPFLGEFGHKIMNFVRLVHFNRAKFKIVCCKANETALYPDADMFYTDWLDPVPDDQKIGTDRNHRDWLHITARFPDAIPVNANALDADAELLAYSPEIRIPFEPKHIDAPAVDVVLATRKRGIFPEKNWPHVGKIGEALTKAGYTFCILGNSETSYDIEGNQFFTGDHSIDLGMQAIKSCKLGFSQDGGGGHLMSAVGCNMVVLGVPDTAAGTTRSFVNRMIETNVGYETTAIGKEYWNDPDYVVDVVMSKLNPKKSKRKK